MFFVRGKKPTGLRRTVLCAQCAGSATSVSQKHHTYMSLPHPPALPLKTTMQTTPSQPSSLYNSQKPLLPLLPI